VATILVYATSSDLATWTGSAAPTNADALLRTASMLVRRQTRTAVYDVDTAGAPTDADTLAAFNQATCAQAAAMAANNVDPAAGVAGASGAVQSTSIGTASITYAVAGDAAASRQALLTELCSEAAMILDDAGLLGQLPIMLEG
jgi:hypothetical protein